MESERVGKYELVRHLATGGMASVYLARLTGLGGFERHVVLKTLRSEGLPDDSLVPMFLDEARLVATLHHQHIAQVYEVGVEDDTYFLAMEYVHGETVRAVLETANKYGQTLPLEFALTIVCAAAAGLHHAHERRTVAGRPLGIVHRDVTPSNVIASFDGSIKLIDFGIAKANDRTTKTRSGFIKGKAGYMAPEQVKGYPVDRRSDVFALGVLAYELTTQARAFHASSQFEQLEHIANGTIVAPSDIVPSYPTVLEDVVMRALEVDPDDRYPDASSFRVEVERVARELGLALGPSCVVRVLEELYGPRPEPWLVAPGQIDYDITPSVAELPLPIEPSELAVGSDPHAEPVCLDATQPMTPEELEPIVEIVGSAPVETAPVEPAPDPWLFQPLPAQAAADVAPLPPPRPAVTTISIRPRMMTPLLIIGGALAVALLAIILGLAFSGSDDDSAAPVAATIEPAAPPPRKSPPLPSRPANPVKPAPVKPAPAPAPAPPPPAPAVTPPAAPGKVMLDVVSDPAESSVVLDGVKIGQTPFHGEVPAKKIAQLKVRRFDRMPMKIDVELDHDVTWNVKLPPK